jgi:hypothetical protein
MCLVKSTGLGVAFDSYSSFSLQSRILLYNRGNRKYTVELIFSRITVVPSVVTCVPAPTGTVLAQVSDFRTIPVPVKPVLHYHSVHLYPCYSLAIATAGAQSPQPKGMEVDTALLPSSLSSSTKSKALGLRATSNSFQTDLGVAIESLCKISDFIIWSTQQKRDFTISQANDFVGKTLQVVLSVGYKQVYPQVSLIHTTPITCKPVPFGGTKPQVAGYNHSVYLITVVLNPVVKPYTMGVKPWVHMRNNL